MTEIERRKFLKVALAAMAGVAGSSTISCRMAMCYIPADMSERSFLCSSCKQMMVVGEKDEILRKYNVPLRIQDQGVDAKLIVPKHCPECGFGLQEGKFYVEIEYPHQPTPVRIELKTAFDLELVAFFFKERIAMSEGRIGNTLSQTRLTDL